MTTIAFLLTIATQSTRFNLMKIYTDQLHYYTSQYLDLKSLMVLVIVAYWQYCSLYCLVNLRCRRKLGKVYDFISNFDKDFKLNAPVTEKFQIKYFRQVLFHAKIYANETDNQKSSNMIDLSDFIGDNDIYRMKEKIVKLHHYKNDQGNELKRTPKPNDKEAIKKRLVPINKEYHDIHATFQKNYNNAKSKFMISTEMTTNEN